LILKASCLHCTWQLRLQARTLGLVKIAWVPLPISITSTFRYFFTMSETKYVFFSELVTKNWSFHSFIWCKHS
jgi:hypothetical protein